MPSFDAVVKEILEDAARRNPAWATTEGFPGFDHALADPSRAAHERDPTRLRAHLDALARAEGGAPIDREALRSALALELYQSETLRAWEKNPDLATELMDHVFPLLLRVERPLAERVAAMTSRLAGARAFLDAGRSRLALAKVPPLWVDVAIESAEQAPAFLDAVLAAARDAPADARAGLEAAAREAGAAIADHLEWLRREARPAAAGEWAIGEAAFAGLLSARLLPHTVEELWRTGQDLVVKHRAETREAALAVLASRGKLAGADPIGEAVALVRERRPGTFADVLAAYRDAIEDAKAFVAKRGIATVPADAPLDVIETPSYLRHLVPFAAYVQPARFDRRSRGTYLVTPKADLGAFPFADIRNTTVHEAYPGHHLQLAVARDAPLARALSSAPEMSEGWALYCEALLGRHGYTAAPEEALVRSKDALWRACRVVLDVGLHTQRVTFRDAVEMLRREAAMSIEEAEAEVKRYTLSPAYNLSYLMGRLAFERLRAAREAADARFSERTFHDAVLKQGTLPMPLLARAAFGTDSLPDR